MYQEQKRLSNIKLTGFNFINPSTSITKDDIDSHFELIKIIKRYECCSGWTLLIAPDHLPKKEVLLSCSINLDKVLIVHKKHCQDVLNCANRALRHDNCSALVIWSDLLTGTEVANLQGQARSVGTALYMLDNVGSNQEKLTH